VYKFILCLLFLFLPSLLGCERQEAISKYYVLVLKTNDDLAFNILREACLESQKGETVEVQALHNGQLDKKIVFSGPCQLAVKGHIGDLAFSSDPKPESFGSTLSTIVTGLKQDNRPSKLVIQVNPENGKDSLDYIKSLLGETIPNVRAICVSVIGEESDGYQLKREIATALQKYPNLKSEYGDRAGENSGCK